MGFEERGPGRSAFSLGRRLDPLALEHVRHRAVGDFVPDVRLRPLDPVAAPGRVLVGDRRDQRRQFVADRRPARRLLSLLARVPLGGDQPPMPAEERVGRDQFANVAKQLAPSGFPLAAKRRRWSSFSRKRPGPSSSLSTRICVRWNSIVCACSRLIHPASAARSSLHGCMARPTIAASPGW